MIRGSQGSPADSTQCPRANDVAQDDGIGLTAFQVEILQLENALSAARHRLGEMRKISYQEE